MDNLQRSIIPDYTKVGLCLFAIFITTFTFPTTSSGSVSPLEICYQLGAGGGDINVQIESLASRTDEMRSQAGDIKSYMKAKFNWVDPQTDYLNKQHFINITELTFGDDNGNVAEENDVDWAKHLQIHYRLLDLLLRYINNIESNGTVDDMELVELLVDSLGEIKSLECIVITALAKLEVDYTQIIEEPYSLVQGFFNSGVNISLSHIRYRAYIVMNDFQMLMQYLNQVYQNN